MDWPVAGEPLAVVVQFESSLLQLSDRCWGEVADSLGARRFRRTQHDPHLWRVGGAALNTRGACCEVKVFPREAEHLAHSALAEEEGDGGAEPAPWRGAHHRFGVVGREGAAGLTRWPVAASRGRTGWLE